MTNIAIFAAVILIYPLAVLCVAITGPHHPAERAEYERFKREKRKGKR